MADENQISAQKSRPGGWLSACRKSPPAGSSCGRSRRNKIESVISGGVYVGNDTSHEMFDRPCPGTRKKHFHGFPGAEPQRRNRASGFTRRRAFCSLCRRHQGENSVQPGLKRRRAAFPTVTSFILLSCYIQRFMEQHPNGLKEKQVLCVSRNTCATAKTIPAGRKQKQ